ncbi:hypothetical protein [Fervidobacterium thailandense]|uniref:Uncharacterized protein n=1 Tax=Fervidobacterium thailandense TaxID=1008305 RepID=A0A1E3G279_9BACT|nr:hypothetical protein [Fervidobacterium thailandense]ODN30339.1 hypothetical protein A4H02_05670 [Fervidobacterium thailandense]
MFSKRKLSAKVWIPLLTIILAITTLGETLFLSVSPFDTSWGILAKTRIRFWKFDIGLSANVDVLFKNGFPQLKPNFDNLIDYFNFENEPYVVKYSFLGPNVPFTTFLNPAKKSWYASWVNTGYVDEYVFHKGEFFSILGNADKLNVTLDFKIFEVFAEREVDNLNFGIGKFVYLYFGNKTGLGLFYPQKNWMVYVLTYLDPDFQLKLAYGLYLGWENVTLALRSDEELGFVGDVVWKVGELNVAGRLEGQKVRVAFHFPIW